NPDSFHVHLETLPLSKLLTSSRLLKNDSRYLLRITLTGSIANEKDSNQTSFEYLSLRIIESGRHYNRFNRRQLEFLSLSTADKRERSILREALERR
ncbi:hypothetical protein, partial [Burkholderia sp. BE17]|uniref:hypothetical protein n=1 Tax=Burkholderia sp. BE17 TaxID=2656644 RepID=UPI001D1063EA